MMPKLIGKRFVCGNWPSYFYITKIKQPCPRDSNREYLISPQFVCLPFDCLLYVLSLPFRCLHSNDFANPLLIKNVVLWKQKSRITQPLPYSLLSVCLQLLHQQMGCKKILQLLN